MTLFILSLTSAALMTLWVWLSRRTDPRGLPWVTGGYFALLACLPLLEWLPKISYQLAPGDALAAVAQLPHNSASSTALLPWLTLVWGIGVFVLLVKFIRSRLSLSRWVNDSIPAGEIWQNCASQCALRLGINPIPVREKINLTTPVVSGLIRPVILVPTGSAAWSTTTREMVMLHELCHVKRKDLWLRFAADVVLMLHWYNPFVWWMAGRLSEQCEYACDAEVLSTGAENKTYITALCDVAESIIDARLPAGIVSMASGAPLSQRVDRIICRKRIGAPWLALVVLSITVISVVALTSVKPVRGISSALLDAAEEEVSADTMADEVRLRHAADPFPGNSE